MGNDKKMKKKSTTTTASSLPPPLPGLEGKWVVPEVFRGTKSFGFYECQSEKKKCKNRWTSAHAFAEYEQGCKACEHWNLPMYMWLNNKNTSNDDGDKYRKGKAPHDSERCKACKKGKCSSGQRL